MIGSYDIIIFENFGALLWLAADKKFHPLADRSRYGRAITFPALENLVNEEIERLEKVRKNNNIFEGESVKARAQIAALKNLMKMVREKGE